MMGSEYLRNGGGGINKHCNKYGTNAGTNESRTLPPPQRTSMSIMLFTHAI